MSCRYIDGEADIPSIYLKVRSVHVLHRPYGTGDRKATACPGPGPRVHTYMATREDADPKWNSNKDRIDIRDWRIRCAYPQGFR